LRAPRVPSTKTAESARYARVWVRKIVGYAVITKQHLTTEWQRHERKDTRRNALHDAMREH
jgi:hypothetical protein